MEDLARIKETFIIIKKNLNPKKFFICNLLFESIKDDESFAEECFNYLLANKPSENNKYSEYTKSEFWRGDFVWWYGNTIKDKPKIIKIKKKYLTDLINSI